MTAARFELTCRFAGGLVAAGAAWQFGRSQFGGTLPAALSWAQFADAVFLLVAVIAFCCGFLLGPRFTIRPFLWLRERVTHMPAADLLAAAGGMIVGLLIGVLLAWPLSLLPFFGGFMPLVASLVLGYLGLITAVSHRRDLVQLLASGRTLGRAEVRTASAARALVDTSAIIDGRLADLAQTGFLPRTLILPRFVLAELQHIADSPDTLRRNRGRRGLEVVERLQQETRIEVELSERDLDRGLDVDGQLVRLARELRCAIITTDYNLNRVAGIQGVEVLNVNDLGNAVRAVVLPGEALTVRIVQDGREAGQGVGYLEDGTMVVVEHGRPHLNTEVDVVVMRMFQTAAGRMVFAQVRAGRNGPVGA